MNYFSSYAQRFKAGISVGASTSQVDGDSYGGYNKSGFTGGGFVSKLLNEHWSVQFEIMYIEKGSRHTPTDQHPTYYLLELNYAEVPLIVRYKYKKIGYEAGVALGALVREREVIDYYDYSGVRPFRKLEPCIALGMSYSLFKGLEINGRFSYSAIAIRNHPAGPPGQIVLGERNNVMCATLRYTFGQHDKKQGT